MSASGMLEWERRTSVRSQSLRGLLEDFGRWQTVYVKPWIELAENFKLDLNSQEIRSKG